MKKIGFDIVTGSNSDLVAIYYNDKGNKAFNIIETRNSYISTCCIKGIHPRVISYSDAFDLCTEEERHLPAQEWKKKVIEHVCEMFEKDYKLQVDNLLNNL